ncbi:FecR family protein [Sphingobacterium psychroaquaticum]|uniref:FecR family protein n=1 Tax=Sphingobacterium psychroaquaticum TaxID=561061 RepID=A0A1X7KFN2_9SPHI|nr:FecR family protein [Sphingobacterium psychroaquaticum]SMG39822.1 FecR family protein [Sphingobacterium psychroaquaticum]
MSSEDQYFLQLIQKFLDNSISPSEQESLYNLMAEDENKIDLYLYLTKSKQPSVSSSVAAESVFEKSKDKYQPNESGYLVSNEKKVQKKYTKKKLLALAAVALFFVISGISYQYLPSEQVATITLACAKSERKFFRLKDGTEIWLNGESQLKYDAEYGITNRNVHLSGEAYFNVAKNKEMPFLLDAYGNTIEVLGTQFNVRAYPEEQKMETALFEGKVNLKVKDSGKTRSFIMKPGEKIEITNIMTNAMRINRQQIDAAPDNPKVSIDFKKIQTDKGDGLDLLWTKNKLVFQNDPLEIIAKKMERWYNKTIIIENDNLRSEPFSGVFEEKNCRDILNILIQTGIPLKFKEKQDSIIIY